MQTKHKHAHNRTEGEFLKQSEYHHSSNWQYMSILSLTNSNATVTVRHCQLSLRIFQSTSISTGLPHLTPQHQTTAQTNNALAVAVALALALTLALALALAVALVLAVTVALPLPLPIPPTHVLAQTTTVSHSLFRFLNALHLWMDHLTHVQYTRTD